MRNNRWRHAYRDADSAFEKLLLTETFKELLDRTPSPIVFHPKPPISYSVGHSYTPDFALKTGPQSYILIEAKGRFMDSTEAAKYKWVRDSLSKSSSKVELVFLFQKPNLAMPNVKARKDGTKQTHGEWASKNGFRWFTKDTIKDIL